MIELVKIDIKTFKKRVFKHYKQLFPESERRPYFKLKYAYKNQISDFLVIKNNNDLIGFAILNHVDNIDYVHLDYFSILPEFQNQGNGSKVISLLKDYYKNYCGILIEIEKNSENDSKNNDIIRRDKFYRRLGFIPLNYEYELFGVKYKPCILKMESCSINEIDIVEKMFSIYETTIGKRNVKKHCSYICLGK